MQLMSWTVSRLGSRFTLHFEPYHRRVLHSAMGRFFDAPLDLMVGLVEPDGTERVLPFSQKGELLYNCEQFERMNSVTFRGYSEKYRLCFELNVHSVFYPQDDSLCTLPALYLEMRINAAKKVRWQKPVGATPGKVKLFIRLNRPGTQITPVQASEAAEGVPATGAGLELGYEVALTPDASHRAPELFKAMVDDDRRVKARERLVSLNPEAVVEPDGKGLTLELPVTEVGSGTKWRLVWGSHIAEPVVLVGPGEPRRGRFRYVRERPTLEVLMRDAVTHRDEFLAKSRRFEKLFDQTPLRMVQRHLMSQSFQTYLASTFLCDLEDPSTPGHVEPWYSVMEGASLLHSTLDVEYNTTMFYLAVWPQLLALELDQWPRFAKEHAESGGSVLSHDLGQGSRITGQTFTHDMEVEENCNYLLMLQAYSHWTGNLSIGRKHLAVLERLAVYLLWSDRDGCGFPTAGTANTLADAGPAMQYARKQTYLGVKRVAALRAAADLLGRLGGNSLAERCDAVADADAAKIEAEAWLGDHYAVCVDASALGMTDSQTGQPLPFEVLPGWDAYSNYTANGLLLPIMCAQPCSFDMQRLHTDMNNARRETLGPYGCAHTSFEADQVWISQNLWRDHFARYLGVPDLVLAHRYWDLEVMSNTHQQSLGYCDSYIGNHLAYTPRGVASFGYIMASPRLVVDRLAPGGGERISVEPARHLPQRWPLLPLADWKAGKIPICVVDGTGRAYIEAEIDPVIVHGEESGVIG